MRLAHMLAAVSFLACTPSRDPRPTPQRAVARAVVANDAGVRACDPSPRCPSPSVQSGALDDDPAWRALRSVLARPASEIDLAEVSLIVSSARTPSLDRAAVLRRLDAMADEVRRATAPACTGRCRLRALTQHIFRVWGFRAVSDPNELYNDPELDLLDRVIARRQGYCEGLSLLYLALARRLDIPLAPVLTRLHIYVRYTGADGVLDVDATHEGAPPRLDPDSARCAGPRLYNRTLDAREMAAQVVSVVGIIDELPQRRAWLDAAVSLAPDDPDLRNNRGVERERGYDLAGALDDYRAAAALDPCASFYRANVAAVLRRMGRFEEARAALDALDAEAARGEADDDAVSRILARADLALDTRRDDEALRLYSQALARSHHAPIAWESRGLAKLLVGDARGAADDLAAALDADPRAETRLWRVEALLDLGDPGASDELERAARDGAPSEDVAFLRARMALARGRVDEATAQAERCVREGGVRGAKGLSLLAEAAARRGDGACARAYAEAFGACVFPPRDRYRARLDARVRAALAQGVDAGR